MLKIHGRNTSINVMKVLWTCDTLNIPYTRDDVGGPFGKNNEPWYLALNPNARVPTIDDDGFILWESNSVVRYLAAKHGMGKLWPAGTQARADVDRWMDWQLSVLGPAMTPIFWQLIRTPADKRDAAAMAASHKASVDALKILDAHLVSRDFVGGTTLTMGDIPVAPFVHRWYAMPIERPKLSNVEKYYARLLEIPAYKTHCAQPLS
jgi:glutathione S-transferase